MHNFKLGQKVYHEVDEAPFEVVGIRKDEIEIMGDWSGGVQPINEKCWVKAVHISHHNKKRQGDNMICRCGHKHKEHTISLSINYTAGNCTKCDCLNFVIAWWQKGFINYITC